MIPSSVILFCVMLALLGPNTTCVTPIQVESEIAGIRNDISSLESVAEELSVWKKSTQADTINYGGAGWVVVGTSSIALIFLGSGLMLVKSFRKRGKTLHLLTSTVKSVGQDFPDTIQKIKNQLKREVASGEFLERDRKNLGDFARKAGTFMDKSEV